MSQATKGESEAQPSIPTFSVTDETDNLLEGRVNGIPTKILIDTGAAATVLSSKAWEKAKTVGEKLESSNGKKLVGVQGTPLQLRGITRFQVKLQGELLPVEVTIAEDIATDLILGRDFLRAYHCTIEMGKTNDVLHNGETGVSVIINNSANPLQVSVVNVVLDCSQQVPPYSEMEVMGRVPGYASGKTWVMEGRKTYSPVLVARAIVRPEGARVPLRVVNLRDEQVRVPKQVPIAQIELLPEDASATIAAVKEESSTGADDAQHRALWKLVNNSER